MSLTKHLTCLHRSKHTIAHVVVKWLLRLYGQMSPPRIANAVKPLVCQSQLWCRVFWEFINSVLSFGQIIWLAIVIGATHMIYQTRICILVGILDTVMQNTLGLIVPNSAKIGLISPCFDLCGKGIGPETPLQWLERLKAQSVAPYTPIWSADIRDMLTDITEADSASPLSYWKLTVEGVESHTVTWRVGK